MLSVELKYNPPPRIRRIVSCLRDTVIGGRKATRSLFRHFVVFSPCCFRRTRQLLVRRLSCQQMREVMTLILTRTSSLMPEFVIRMRCVLFYYDWSGFSSCCCLYSRSIDRSIVEGGQLLLPEVYVLSTRKQSNSTCLLDDSNSSAVFEMKIV
jgi:hypothetical protein